VGLLKGGVFENKPRNADDPKTNITNETAVIPPAMAAATFAGMESSVGLFLQLEGNNFLHLL
jgi:hypothetical protein